MRAWVVALVGACVATAVVAGPIETSAGRLQVQAVATGLEEPWALEFLPDGRFLVTERDAARLWLYDGQNRVQVAGLPEVSPNGQGGLMDVMVPQDFAASRRIWLTYAAEAEGGWFTALSRARLSEDGSRLEQLAQVFRGQPMPGGRHFGSRVVEGEGGTVWLLTGDRGTGPEGMEAQDPARPEGKVFSFSSEGQPLLTPFPGGLPGVFSIGHRNPQGAAVDAGGRLWLVEHGPQGGDELNLITLGQNYGWPVITWGEQYGGGKIGDGAVRDGMAQPVHYWVPSIAPSGLMIYSGRLIPVWKGSFFTGSLNADFISRLGPAPAATGLAEERLASPETGRVRDVAEAPDGAIWFLSVTDGAVYRIAP